MKIELLNLTQTVLLIPGGTGVIYTNQVGGTECDYPEIEGSIVPIEYDFLLEKINDSLTWKICKLFQKENSGILDQQAAKKIQNLLNSSVFTSDIEIDWGKLKESKEAWLHVNIKGSLGSIIQNREVKKAILTWPNSD